MKLARSLIAKFFSALCSLFGIPFIFSCGDNGIINKTVTDELGMYGMPPNYGYISGTVKGDINDDGTATPLANVKIYCENASASFSTTIDEESLVYQTAEEGTYFVELWEDEDYVFRFEDGDGLENGLFKSQTKTFSYKAGNKQSGQDITLEKE